MPNGFEQGNQWMTEDRFFNCIIPHQDFRIYAPDVYCGMYAGGPCWRSIQALITGCPEFKPTNQLGEL
jgi:hypothetical protein